MGLMNLLIMVSIIFAFALIEVILIQIVIRGLNKGIERIDQDIREGINDWS